ncbi:hypothetical protein RU01_20840 [Rhodococcus sp. MEB064]|nr:hypothetical protein RU01_20840 [Rhodococcus sp. MEB064]
MRSPGRDDAALVRHDDGLRSIPQTEFAQNLADVGLDGLFGEDESRGDLGVGRSDCPVPPWFPVLSFASATVDLILATDAPAGHGHRYGPEQGAAIVDQTADGCGNSPRAAS